MFQRSGEPVADAGKFESRPAAALAEDIDGRSIELAHRRGRVAIGPHAEEIYVVFFECFRRLFQPTGRRQVIERQPVLAVIALAEPP